MAPPRKPPAKTTPAKKASKKRGARIAVVFRSKKGEEPALYSRVLKDVADKLGLKQVNPVSGKKTPKSNKDRPLKGSKGAGSMKIPSGSKTKSGSDAYYSIPVPSGATVSDQQAFCKKLKSLKPTYFITHQGGRYDVAQKAGA